jgi:ribose-phosphate pyrophosphokinase
MNKDVLLLGFPEYHQQASRLAQSCDIPYETLQIHSFPDGESKITLPSQLADHIIICRSLNDPNEKLIELIMVAASVRLHGAITISLIAPYLCYMRQDKAFHKGEVISQQVIGDMLAHYFDNILTVDAHLHRIAQLSQAIPAQKAINITATDPMAHFIQNNIKQPFLIGPDGESEQWVADIAAHYQMDYRIATKERYGDAKVNINLPAGDYQQRNIVLVDDVASTGKTLLGVAQKLADYSPASISVLVTHALFVDEAITELQQANVSNIWSCDSIPHKTNCIFLADFLAKTVNDFIYP